MCFDESVILAWRGVAWAPRTLAMDLGLDPRSHSTRHARAFAPVRDGCAVRVYLSPCDVAMGISPGTRNALGALWLVWWSGLFSRHFPDSWPHGWVDEYSYIQTALPPHTPLCPPWENPAFINEEYMTARHCFFFLSFLVPFDPSSHGHVCPTFCSAENTGLVSSPL